MDDEQIRLECLKLAQSGDAHRTIEAAKLYYDWVCPPEVAIGENGVVMRRRGRPPKQF
jgi:hypothetical protein